jgi:hypothetical protein
MTTVDVNVTTAAASASTLEEHAAEPARFQCEMQLHGALSTWVHPVVLDIQL